MSLEGQRLQPERYALIPRTLSFILHGDEILLIKVPENRGAWSGLFNGVGGHVERGEEPLSAAYREIKEETNLTPTSLRLSGIVQIDTKTNPGIGLFVFLGHIEAKGETIPGPEGIPEWIHLDHLDDTPLVEDLPQLIPKVLSSVDNDFPFFARYHYDPEDQLSIVYSS
jgi:8-oxo-dGTP diphosphatase